MYRPRRRRTRDIPFGLDSFLDIIANVIGIIIRMILVVWVGARSYHALHSRPQPEPAEVRPQPATPVPEAVPRDPLEDELARQSEELRVAQQRLLEHLRQLPPLASRQADLSDRLAALAPRAEELRRYDGQAGAVAAAHDLYLERGAVALEELRRRGAKLRGEIAALEKEPVPIQTLSYRAPVSRPVLSEEIFFECRGGKVAFIDIEGFLSEMKDEVTRRLGELKHLPRFDGVTRPIGAFRLRYTVEQGNPLLDAGPRLAEWTVEPVQPTRGEPVESAMRRTSEFRRIADYVDPRQTVVTFWVYPDSFAVFRELRDYLYRRDVEVAARPLPDGVPVRASRHGTRSRGQ